MAVRQILEVKGREVVTLAPDVTMLDVAKTLAEHRIGALVLTEPDGMVAGIVSERDIVRIVGRAGPESLQKPVREIMTMKVTTCTEDTTIDEAMAVMTNGRFRHLPVCVQGRLVGIVSIGDIVKQRIQDAEREASDMREYIAAG